MAYGTIEDAKVAIATSSLESCVYLGCDSVRFKKKVPGRKEPQWFARYTTVVILHYDGRHGARVFQETETIPDYGNVATRMLNEVGFTTKVGLELIDVIGERPFEIHIDVNPNPKHKSHAALGAARGMILGTFGFEPKFKPDALAATHGADHVVRGK